MGEPKGSQQVEEQTPPHTPHAIHSGEAASNRETAAPQSVVLVAAYTSKGDDHDHDHAQVPPTPATYQAEQVFAQPPSCGCSDERAVVPTAVTHAADGINTGEWAAGAGPARSPTSPSAGAVGCAQEREGDRCKTIDSEAATPTADSSSSGSNNDDGEVCMYIRQ